MSLGQKCMLTVREAFGSFVLFFLFDKSMQVEYEMRPLGRIEKLLYLDPPVTSTLRP